MIDNSTSELVARLAAHQSARGLEDASFAREQLTISASTWSRLKAGTYKLTADTRVADKLETALRFLDSEAELGKVTVSAPLVITSRVRAALNAVKLARTETRNRLVVFLGKTGAGKSNGVARAILKTYPARAVVVQCNETWRSSYYAAAKDMAVALDVKEELTGASAAQAALIERLNQERPILIIDEGHYFGPRTLNLVKLILNDTPCVVVLLAIPSLWRAMERSTWEESEQLRSRTAAKIEQNDVDARDAALFIRELLPVAGKLDTFPRIVESCRAAANRFGLFDTISRICREVSDECGDQVTPDAFDNAIAQVEALRK